MSEDNPGLIDGAIAPSANRHLFGHEEAEAFLAQSYASGKGHHAILIEGPEGIGKATLAFRFAAHVLSYPEPKQAPSLMSDPDPDAPQVRQIASGASHNLIHLARPYDEKTKKFKTVINVDEVRRLGKFFGQTSGTGNWRLAIIDPADDMNTNAANALLKILEEPPKRSMLLLLSHSPGKLLPTIRSRCLQLKLSPLGDEAMLRALANLGISLSGAEQGQILAAAQGSVAKALKLINYGGFEIIRAFQDALGATGPTQRRLFHKLADVLSGKDSEVIHDFFMDHVGEELVTRARQAALAGDLARADVLAKLSQDIGQKIAIADGYNLDRKQTILSILEQIG